MLTSALRDKLRPETLGDVVGNARAKEFLRSMVEAKAFEHLIFTGPIGTGKSTLAEIVRRELTDPHWSAMLKSRLNASHYSGVDFVRDLLRNASFVGQRVYVLDEAHALSTQAQTALLSAMESQDSNDLFFFCTTELHRLLPALRRRCRKIFLHALAPDERVELIVRGWRVTNGESPIPEDFVAAVQASELGSPALIFNALDNYLAGATPDEAVACEQLESDRPVPSRIQPDTHSMKPIKQGGRWSPRFDLDRAIQLHRAGKNCAEIGRELGVSCRAIWGALNWRGIAAKRKPKFDLNRAIALRSEGKSFRQIGCELGVTDVGILSAFRRNGIVTKRVPQKNAIDVTRALTLRSAGLTWKEIGQALGKHGSNVWLACKRRESGRV
jgi:hypothetical protein